MELVAYVGKDKENWGQITALINRFECEKVVLVTSKDTEEFPITSKCEVIKIDSQKPLTVIKEELLEKFRKSITGDFEVAISLASGTGKEHMALISALLSVPVGIKLVIYTKDGVQFLS